MLHLLCVKTEGVICLTMVKHVDGKVGGKVNYTGRYQVVCEKGKLVEVCLRGDKRSWGLVMHLMPFLHYHTTKCNVRDDTPREASVIIK